MRVATKKMFLNCICPPDIVEMWELQDLVTSIENFKERKKNQKS